MSDAVKEFPILWPHLRTERAELRALGCPRSVPWPLVAPHEAQAVRNHDQTLARLAQRGGLALQELIAVLEEKSWTEHRDTSNADALAAIKGHQQNAAEFAMKGDHIGKDLHGEDFSLVLFCRTCHWRRDLKGPELAMDVEGAELREGLINLTCSCGAALSMDRPAHVPFTSGEN